jgi:hypothetical protein
LAAQLAGTPKVEQYRTKYGKNSSNPEIAELKTKPGRVAYIFPAQS